MPSPLRAFAPRCRDTFVLLAAAWLAGPAFAAADVTVNPDRVGEPVRPAVTAGFNFGNWMPVAEFRDTIAEVPAAALRFPAGNAGDESDLNEATLDTLAAVMPVVPGGPELMVQTRVYQGRDGRPAANGPEDAARAVRLARERGLKVTMWEIGNEPDLYGPVRGDNSWTPERYCAVFRAQAEAIRREQPGARIAGPAVSGAVPGARRFLEAFVTGCGDVVDVLTWHLYPTEGDGGDAWALRTVADADRSLTEIQALWRDPKRNPRGHQRTIAYGVTEYGLSWRTERPRFLADQTAALWAMETALRLGRGGAEIGHYFAYLTTGFHGLLDNAGAPRPTFYGFRLLSALRGNFVDVSAKDDHLWTHATRDGDTLRVVLINTREQALPVKLTAGNYRVQSVQWFDAGIADREDPYGTLPAEPALRLPARSATLVTLTR